MSLSAVEGFSPIAAQPSVASSPAASSGTGFSTVLHKKQASSDLDGIFAQASQTYGVPEELLRAVAKTESGFRPTATSRCGAMGIMQLMPATARALGVENAYDPKENILGGAKYLRQLLQRFDGDQTLAVAAYNAGPGSVEKYGGVPPYAETQAYVKKVLGAQAGDLSCVSPLSSADLFGGNASSQASALMSGIFSAAQALTTNAAISQMAEMTVLRSRVLAENGLFGDAESDQAETAPAGSQL